jgi:hypothetical protein
VQAFIFALCAFAFMCLYIALVFADVGDLEIGMG